MGKTSIVFLCGSMEPGRDGVGDYTRRLAGEVIRQGHQASIISLYDQFRKTPILVEQNVDDIEIDVYRLPSKLSQKERFKLAKDSVQKSDAEWLSLQFVPFSFHKRGMPFSWPYFLNSLGENRKWHIMFHELWLGIHQEAILKNRIIGYVQKRIFKQLYHQLQPITTHTHAKYYQYLLGRLIRKPKQLPLFSNIAVTKGIEPIKSDHKITFVVFGGIAPISKFEAFTKEIAQYIKASKKEVSLIILGRSGPQQKEWVSVWTGFGLKCEVLGEMESQDISEVLQRSDIAISTTPIPLIEKSGTAAAMLAHEIPIISVAQTWTPEVGFKHTPLRGTVQYANGNLKRCLSKYTDKLVQPNSLETIAQEFVMDIN